MNFFGIYTRWQKRILSSLITIAVLLSGCDKEEATEEDPLQEEGLVTPVGTPTAEAVTASIGPTGGSLALADGSFVLNIPADALSEATTISIQPITTETPLGVGSAFRLLPHGQTFAKAVTLSFHVHESMLSNKSLQALGVAYQDEEGVWQAMPGVSAQAAGSGMNTVQVSTTHFSDWSIFESYVMTPKAASLETGESIGLEVFHLGDLLEPLVPMPIPEPKVLQGEQVKEWLINGEVALPSGGVNGSLVELGTHAQYTAPNSPPAQNPVSVSAEVEVPGSGAKLLLVSHFFIGGNYVLINGGPFENARFNGHPAAPGFGVYSTEEHYTSLGYAGVNESGQTMSVSISFPGNTVGSKNWSIEPPVTIGLTHTQGTDVLSAAYSIRPTDPPTSHEGTTQINQYEEVDGVISGSFSGEVTIIDNSCSPPCVSTGTAEGNFAVPRGL